MRNASMKVLKNLVCCAAFICLMFVLAMPAHAASKADELLQLVNAERAQAGVAPLSMGSSALNAAAQARAKELTVNYSYNRPNGSREFTIKRMEAHVWSVDAPWLEYILAGSNVDDYESLQFFQRQLGESGILDALVQKGVQENDTILIGEYQFDYIF